MQTKTDLEWIANTKVRMFLYHLSKQQKKSIDIGTLTFYHLKWEPMREQKHVLQIIRTHSAGTGFSLFSFLTFFLGTEIMSRLKYFSS